MAKYADITPFYEWLDWLEKESNTPYAEYETLMFYEIRYKLDDLQEAVLCKDCIDSAMYSQGRFCECWGHYVEDDFYCANGERKDNG